MTAPTKIIVLSGGSSPERDVSLRSGKVVTTALEACGYEVRAVDPQDGLQHYGAELEQAQVVFPVLHGSGGEDGTAQQALETISVPFVGSSSSVSALCFDKQLAKERLEAAGVTVAKGEVVTAQTFWQSPLIAQPFVLKPVDGGSSIDTHIIRDVANMDRQPLDRSLQLHTRMLLEELIDGIEITVGVIGEKALPVIEIIPPKNGEFDYDNKYNGKTTELCPPKHVTPGDQLKAQRTALNIHHILGCRDLSRTDFIMTADGTLYALETNTLPGMTDQSLLPKAAAAAGISMEQLVDRLVQMALKRAHKS
ncbi:MAG TPA: D-alanine--D-alanine ligase [Candidatus Saccharimonadales bacterium]|nr:D-alanine--D-alanine ligase [Candidatus Saccharimonadales bacterium]